MYKNVRKPLFLLENVLDLFKKKKVYCMNLNCYLFETWVIKDMSDLHYYKIHFNSII